MFTLGILLSSFVISVFAIILMNISAIIVIRIASDKVKNPSPNYNELSLQERMMNLLCRISYTPIASSLTIMIFIFISAFIEKMQYRSSR